MDESSDSYREELQLIEREVLEVLDLVSIQLAHVLQALDDHDVELARSVVAGDKQINRTYRELQRRSLRLLARHAPVPGDLRLVAAVLQIARCIERMGDQCVSIAKLIPLYRHHSQNDAEIATAIACMGRLAGGQITQVKQVLKTRDVFLANDLTLQDKQINRLNRTIFQRAVDIGDDTELREWSMFMILTARAVERVGDNTVDIAEQVAYIATGHFKNIKDALAG